MKRYAAFLLILPFVFTIQCAPPFLSDDGGDETEFDAVTLTGRVLFEDGRGAPGVTVTASVTTGGGPGCSGETIPPQTYTLSTVTDSAGRYSFRDSSGYFYDGIAVDLIPQGVAAGCPDRCLYEPWGLVVLVYAPATTAPDILVVPAASVRGVVTLADGVTHLEGIVIELGGGGWGSVVTDSGGGYLFPDLYAGTYVVTPVQAEYTYNPTSREVFLYRGDRFVADFTGTQTAFSLSGVVRLDGTGVENVLLRLAGSSEGFAYTYSDGSYRFSYLPAGGYTITPEDPGLTFNPPSREVLLDGSDLTSLDFDASAL